MPTTSLMVIIHTLLSSLTDIQAFSKISSSQCPLLRKVKSNNVKSFSFLNDHQVTRTSDVESVINDDEKEDDKAESIIG